MVSGVLAYLEVWGEVDRTIHFLEQLLEWREDDLRDRGQVSIRTAA